MITMITNDQSILEFVFSWQSYANLGSSNVVNTILSVFLIYPCVFPLRNRENNWLKKCAYLRSVLSCKFPIRSFYMKSIFGSTTVEIQLLDGRKRNLV